MQCPKCQNELAEDFGVVTCSNCHSIMSIDLDGNIFLQDENVNVSQFQSIDATTDSSIQLSEIESLENKTQDSDFLNILPDADSLDLSLDDNLMNELESEMLKDENVQTQTGLHAITPDNPIEESASLTNEVINSEAESFKNEVIEFSENVQTSDKLIYEILISKLDISSKKLELAEILNDPKLHLSQDTLFEQIQNGQLKLTGLNSVKASLLIRKLLQQKFEVEWSQNAY